MEIQFPNRMATFLSWSAAASHLVSVKLTPCCTRSFISNLNCTLLYASSRSTAMAKVCSFLWNLDTFSQVFFLLYVLLDLGESMFLLSKSRASFLSTIRSISFPVVFCMVTIRYPFSLIWSFPGLGLAWGNYETSPQEPVLLRSFLYTV